MKTIEERVRLAARQIWEDTDLSEHSVDRVAEIIEEKINEQKAIDIDKACEWLERANSALPPCYKMFEVNIENFRKAMEG